MATRNSDGTVVLKTTGRLFRDGATSAAKAIPGIGAKSLAGGTGLVYAGATGRVGRPGWRVVGRTER